MNTKIAIAFIVALSVSVSAAFAESFLDGVKQGVGKAVDTVSDTARSVTEKESPAETRAKIDAMAKAALGRLLAEHPEAKGLFDRSYGYAVFDTRKFSFMITTGFGAGVAVEKANGARTYMKMATGGVNVGLGGEFFQLVFLFENAGSFAKFVNDGFEAGSEASAVMGKDAKGIEARFIDGLAVYELTEKGLKFTADITGTKYWKNNDLN